MKTFVLTLLLAATGCRGVTVHNTVTLKVEANVPSKIDYIQKPKISAEYKVEFGPEQAKKPTPTPVPQAFIIPYLP